jgi:glutathione peroxidase-family protein
MFVLCAIRRHYRSRCGENNTVVPRRRRGEAIEARAIRVELLVVIFCATEGALSPKYRRVRTLSQRHVLPGVCTICVLCVETTSTAVDEKESIASAKQSTLRPCLLVNVINHDAHPPRTSSKTSIEATSLLPT